MDHKYVLFYRKPYKMFHIGGFIMKTIKESISSKEFKKLMIYTRGREDLRKKKGEECSGVEYLLFILNGFSTKDLYPTPDRPIKYIK